MMMMRLVVVVMIVWCITRGKDGTILMMMIGGCDLQKTFSRLLIIQSIAALLELDGAQGPVGDGKDSSCPTISIVPCSILLHKKIFKKKKKEKEITFNWLVTYTQFAKWIHSLCMSIMSILCNNIRSKESKYTRGQRDTCSRTRRGLHHAPIHATRPEKWPIDDQRGNVSISNQIHTDKNKTK